MAVVGGSDRCNLITGYAVGEDNKVDYGRHKWLAQTFTLPDLYVVWRCRLKQWTIQGERGYEYALRNTDAFGKPLAIDICTSSLSPTNESFYPSGKWRRFDFIAFPNLPAGTYALVARVPTATWTNSYKIRCDATASQYPGGKAWESNDNGNTWVEIPNTDLIFEVWGWEPPPVKDPEPTISNWAPLSLLKPEVPTP